MEIKSDLVVATNYAQALFQASDKLAGVEQALLDERTSLAGNSRAHEAVALAQTKAQEIARASQLVAAKIQAISQQLDQLDQTNAQQIGKGDLL
ncbi:TIGR04197 family type VII secretion effector [Streptococcus oricebi]|uniref:Uncharacterized protein n=1 Tax=Streptococcus oricebi TaxID=1547447 RepID=A0ABS5B4N4_9STRE|nr:TIGR04197 family type VII secretion effector [Streptococcus oricebi]MBP2623799.1 hypothetical protein [Streptococcus oricebi]